MTRIIQNYDMWHTEDVAFRYDLEHRGTAGRFIEECEIVPIIDAVHQRAPSRLLDAGCGTGRHLSKIRNGPKLYGIDFSEPMLASARRKIPEGHFVRGSIHKIPFADGFFDMIISVRVFQHLGDILMPLKEFHRVLRHGGEAHILVYNKWHSHGLSDRFRHSNFAYTFSSRYPKGSYWNRLYRDYYNRFYSPREIINAAKQAGFSNPRIVGATTGPSWFLSTTGIDRMNSRGIQDMVRGIVKISRTWHRRFRNVTPVNYFFDTIILVVKR